MARKRMLSALIIDSDAFLDMPLSAQALYMHLNMRADDDGFVGNPKRIQQYIGASSDDLKLLLAKRFILAFENGVIVIKHWKMHNTIQKDRYTPTAYQDELSRLVLNENNSYSDNVYKMETKCIHNVSTGLGIGIDKGKDIDIEKNNKTLCASHPKDDDGFYPPEEDADSLFEELWKMYPNKKGKGSVSKTKKKELLKVGREQMIRCIERYIHDHDELKRSGKFCPEWKNGSTFFNSGYVDYLDENYESADSNGNNVSTEIYGGDRQ